MPPQAARTLALSGRRLEATTFFKIESRFQTNPVKTARYRRSDLNALVRFFQI
jgi:hypothetical protein